MSDEERGDSLTSAPAPPAFVKAPALSLGAGSRAFGLISAAGPVRQMTLWQRENVK
jgi:hypothetical protein